MPKTILTFSLSWPSLSVPPLLPPRSPHFSDVPVLTLSSHPLSSHTLSIAHLLLLPFALHLFMTLRSCKARSVKLLFGIPGASFSLELSHHISSLHLDHAFDTLQCLHSDRVCCRHSVFALLTLSPFFPKLSIFSVHLSSLGSINIIQSFANSIAHGVPS